MINKNYIKMCEQAEEIQKAWKYDTGDWSFCKENNKVILLYFDEDRGGFSCKYTNKEICVWLPTQEQLQEILQKGRKWVYYGSYPLTQFCGWIMTSGGPNKFYHHQYKSLFMSINELWLAFIMHELYNKRWTGKEWITIESTDSPNQKE